jgi:hypothetical protein
MRTSGSILPWPALQQHLRELDDLVYSASDDVIRRKLGKIVPEFQYTEKSHETPDNVPALAATAGLRIAATASAND